MISKLSHATFYVLDQDKALDFYVNKLGFEVKNDMKMDNGFRWLSVSPKEQPDLEIVLFRVGSDGMMAEEFVVHMRVLLEKDMMGGGVFETKDIYATYEDLKSKGVEFTKLPTQEFYGTEALFKDGCGNWFSLTQH